MMAAGLLIAGKPRFYGKAGASFRRSFAQGRDGEGSSQHKFTGKVDHGKFVHSSRNKLKKSYEKLVLFHLG